MPEGDTIHKLARAWSPRLDGRRLEGLWLRDRGWLAPLRGSRVRTVSARGKHLLVEIEQAAGPVFVLHAHLGMKGRAFSVAAGSRWPRPRSQASALVQADGVQHLLFRAAVSELVRREEVSALPGLRRLGPDLVTERLDPEELVHRARCSGAAHAADLLLDQRVACGLGNVYKNEILFLESIAPQQPVAGLGDEQIVSLYVRGQELLRRNLGPGRRVTLPPSRARPAAGPDGRFWVHERRGRPCAVCGAPIAFRRLGDQARPTHWCPACQPGPGLHRPGTPQPPAA